VEKKINTMFVKVNVDGVPIGRKIDLKAYDSYEKLSVALDEMFRGSINALTSDASPLAENNNNNNQASLLNGRDYVFVYEDIEGDRMLVGDVPWEMFVNTVKRLRVMKSSDAGRLANRTQ
jgi:auxin-responsive protein IAA